MEDASIPPPVPCLSLHTVLIECLDALLCPTWDNNHRDMHLEAIRTILNDADLDTSLRQILEKIIPEFNFSNNTSTLNLIIHSKQTAMDLAARLEAWMDEAHLPLFVYHGTIFRKLPRIHNDGLIPGATPVWKEEDAIRQHCCQWPP